MAAQSEKLLVKALHDMSEELKEMRTRFDKQSEQFKKLRKDLRDWRESAAAGTGFAVHAIVRHETVDKQLEQLTQRIERLEKAK